MDSEFVFELDIISLLFSSHKRNCTSDIWKWFWKSVTIGLNFHKVPPFAYDNMNISLEYTQMKSTN